LEFAPDRLTDRRPQLPGGNRARLELEERCAAQRGRSGEEGRAAAAVWRRCAHRVVRPDAFLLPIGSIEAPAHRLWQRRWNGSGSPAAAPLEKRLGDAGRTAAEWRRHPSTEDGLPGQRGLDVGISLGRHGRLLT